jgi:predicted dehydrogenase
MSRGETNKRAIQRVAVVGLGAAGGFAISGLRGLPGARCVAGVDPRGRDAPAAADIGEQVSADIRILDRVAPLDLVVLATPTPHHAATAAEILEGSRQPARLWIEKPLAATRAGHAQIRRARDGDAAQVLLHTAYAPEVLWAVERVASWEGRHGPIVEIACDFDDPYADVVAERAVALGDCWSDSGINALSVIARFVRIDRLVEAAGTLPLDARAVFAGRDDAQRVRVTITTTWTAGSSDKTTVLRFADEIAIVLDHGAATAQVVDSSGATLESHRLGRRPLGERYSPMFASYAAEDRLTFSGEVQDMLHAHLYAAAEQLGPP